MRAVVLCLCWLCPGLVLAQTTTLAWDYDGPAVTGFLLTLVASTGASENLTVAPSPPGACATLPETTPTTFCANLPQCLTTGTWVFLVTAVTDTASSDPSEPYPCTIRAGTPCLCTPSATPLPTLTPPATPPVLPPIEPLPTIPPDVQALLNTVPATPRGSALAGPELLQQALNVSAPPLPALQSAT